ncbi:D-alanyl-D-alanine carboxypeptidase [Arenibaculum pallidiluteum]|uniref:D-alanyl-D-alanine carboxypeptidase n=1 Tax=Arenibaculum pallidiluteum TaxID=2812559 RepID=UPI001A95B758|nr:D-alanyl-D-alanine carboxypeptidase [Arenibaculum pallidiluteum]
MISTLKAGHFLAMALGAALLISGPAAARPPEAEIVIDAGTGEVLHSENADVRTQPASLTKMMTLYLTFEALDRGDLRIDQFLTVSVHASNQSPSKLGLKPGGRIMVEDAIMGLVTRSANDVAVVLAEALAGSESSFAERMTQKARELGMSSTTFRNASGLPNSGQITTARDMATLSQALIKNHPRRYQYFGRAQFVYDGQQIRSHNRLMSRYEGMDGIKTGFVNASGFNLAASARRDGRRLIGVVLGGSSARSRDDRMAALLDDAFGVERLVRSTTRVAALPEPAAPPRLAQGDTVASRVLPAPVSKKARKTAATWTIQVGAFGSNKQAQVNLATVRRNLTATLLGGAKPAVVKSNGKYLARYTGLDQDDAAAACKALERKGQDCMVLKN